MKNNRFQIFGTVLLDIALILYLIVFLHDLTIDIPTAKESIIILLIVIFTIYAHINIFGKKFKSIVDKLNHKK